MDNALFKPSSFHVPEEVDNSMVYTHKSPVGLVYNIFVLVSRFRYTFNNYILSLSDLHFTLNYSMRQKKSTGVEKTYDSLQHCSG
jgi:hypothetical protein